MTRPTIKDLITTEGLHYCCLWAFFKKFGSPSIIADRLGVHKRTVRRYRSQFLAGEYKCEGCDNCLKKRGMLNDITSVKRLR